MSEKLRTARAVKWNAIDRLLTQALYAVTGIVLANLLSVDDFGLAGALLIFQAFASIIIDSGFSYALLQKKSPTRLDYSSVLWFNLGMAAIMYGVLYTCAPLIADIFQHDERLVGLSRVMFLTIILNASSIVQVNQLTKRQNIRPIVVSNAISLTAAGAVGIILAIKGAGAWAIVWQAITNAGVKSLVLWIIGKWVPVSELSWRSLLSFVPVGAGMMLTSTLNTIFLNIYAFFIGNRAGIAPLGYYTQSDKWSKMGVTAISQTLTSSFIPPLSAAQDDKPRFRRLCHKMSRMTAYVTFPAMLWLIVMAEPVFHTLFGVKWDWSIPLFQLLLVRGIFVVLSGLYNNFLLALGLSKQIFWLEVLRDVVALLALFATLPYIDRHTPDNLVWGIEVLLWGQILAAMAAWAATLCITMRAVGGNVRSFLDDMWPYMVIAAVISALLWLVGCAGLSSWLTLLLQAVVALASYIGVNALLGSRIQRDIVDFACGKLDKAGEKR